MRQLGVLKILVRALCRQRAPREVELPAPVEHPAGLAQEPLEIDLVDELSLTFALLDDTRLWRERCVHEFVLRDSDHVEVTTSYQVRIPLELVQRFEPGVQSGAHVRLLLPLTIRPKQLLLNVSLRGVAGTPAALLLRQEAAEVQAQYIAHVDGRPLGDQVLGGTLWYAISAFTVDAWRDHLSSARRTPRGLVSRDHRRVSALLSYLEEGASVSLDRSDIKRWLLQLESARQLLVEALDEGEDDQSPAECMLLAIPFMSVRPAGASDIDVLVTDYVAAISGAGTAVRETVAEYGRRWELLVETSVPVDRLVTLHIADQRPWVGAPSPRLRQPIAFGDASSTHVELRSADHSVVLDKFKLAYLDGRPLERGVIDSVRDSADAISAYSSALDRPYFSEVTVRARVRWAQRIVVIWLLVMIGAAGAVAVSIPESHDFVDSLSLLTFPLTLAGAVVLAREPSALAERLLRRWRSALAAAIGLLWLIALVRLGLYADIGWVDSAWSGMTDALERLADVVGLRNGGFDNG